MTARLETIDYASLPEAELVRLARLGRREAFAAIMRRCNQRLFRVARSIVGNETEAEDVLQEAYVRAFEGFAGFRGESAVLTWLTRIVLNEARGRLRRRRPMVELAEVEAAQADTGQILMFPTAYGSGDPERDAARAQVRRVLEGAVDDLPDAFRLVFILRDVEGCSTEETAEQLGVKPETVKTRLHRARKLLRETLDEQFAMAATGAFPFLGPRCDRITEAVLARVAPAVG